MSFLDKLFKKPDEVQAVLKHLQDVSSDFHLFYFAEIKGRVTVLVTSKQDEIVKMVSQDGTPPRQVVYWFMMNIAGFLLGTDLSHSYTGFLTGEGECFLEVFDTSVDELYSLGAIDKEHVEESKKNVREQIARMGSSVQS
jgi:hypothetical protein